MIDQGQPHTGSVPTETEAPSEHNGRPVSLSEQRQLLIWCSGIVGVILLLYLLRGILLPFVAGMAVAYFLDPLADRLERLGLSRTLATVIITFVFILLIVAGVLVILPTVYQQTISLVQALPSLIGEVRDFISDLSDGRLAQVLGEERLLKLEAALNDATGNIMKTALSVLGSIWTQGLALAGLLSLVFVTPVVAFYMLLDWDRMMDRVEGLLPRKHAETIRGLGREMNDVLAGFVRGQMTVCIVLGTFYATALSVAGLKYGLVVGLIAGLISFIPYLGSLTGFVLSTILAVVQFWPDYWHILLIVAIFQVGQMIEGNYLSPKLVGSNVQLHPVWVMFALFAFGYLFGFVGMLLAVPIAAALGVLVRFAVARYLQSPLYLGSGRDGES